MSISSATAVPASADKRPRLALLLALLAIPGARSRGPCRWADSGSACRSRRPRSSRAPGRRRRRPRGPAWSAAAVVLAAATILFWALDRRRG